MVLRKNATWNGNEPDTGDRYGWDHFKVVFFFFFFFFLQFEQFYHLHLYSFFLNFNFLLLFNFSCVPFLKVVLKLAKILAKN